jgi:NTP pyrophosphatase (non-canonical NTP hydrolase)
MHNDEIYFQNLQKKLWDWQNRNFGPTGPYAPPRHPFLGMCEEAGELVHSVLKMSQGIRGTTEEHIDNIKDAIGDIMVYATNFFYRGNFGFIPYKESYFTVFSENKHYTNIQMEMLAWSVYKYVAHIGLYFEPMFIQDNIISKENKKSIIECVNELCYQLVYICNLLKVTLVSCIDDVWERVLSKRNWVENPQTGVV